MFNPLFHACDVFQYISSPHNINAIVGEASLSYGYESSGKICASSNFADYADPFGEGDIIGVYLVSG